MEIGQMYVQRHGDQDIYIKPTRKQVNGAYAGLMYTDWFTGRFGGKVKRCSFRFMFPEPELIDRLDVDPRIMAKFRSTE